ncbi:Ocs element-binding factor 1 [Gossypium arboreum]|uniref:Ocs element-binding factor 1 n=1 Tax=Gossypium arboreum TaxID=29729 RepID=A0A0B0MUT3_GOSAR|nr:Ocs element-binding factor 1 [Gossypium arboreum]
MEGYSSDGSTSFFSSRMADGWDLISTEFGLVEGSDINGGGGGGRAKLTPAQRKENKRLSDYKYRQKRKITADEQAAEIKHLKEENEQLNAENSRLKQKIGLLLPHGQLEHQCVSAQDHHGSRPEASDRQKNSEFGTCSNDDTSISDLLMKIDADEESKVKFSDFTGLDGKHVTVGKYCFPLSLHPTLKLIIKVHGDVAATSKMNPSIAERIYIMFCASIKEMHDLRLEQITECRILKWRDAIKDALRMNFKVDFAMEHLKKIACAYIGLMEHQRQEEVALRISKLEAELSASKKEHSKICERSKVYMDTEKEFIGKPVSLGMLKAENRRFEEQNRRIQRMKHLNYLQQSIIQYKHENSQIMTAIQVTTQRYLGIETENFVLRAELSELNARLQSLNDIESISLMNESNDGTGGGTQS